MRIRFAAAIVLLIMISFHAFARGMEGDSLLIKSSEPTAQVKWYDRIQFRGYLQVRYNGLLETNSELGCSQCDKSWGTGGFFLRRIRMVFSGQIHERVFLYIQPDFASGGENIAQIRDAYFDVGLDAKQEFRLRVGQSKIPFGFENLQSSQNRIPLDRNDGLNSAVLNERDLGVFFYYAPEEIRERFRYLVSSGLKGSGDYGMFGLGIYNGQAANSPEKNGNFHVVSRLTYPMKLPSGQFVEASLQGYTGKFVINRNPLSDFDQTEFPEYRVASTLVIYPQPFGFQAEFNWGKGPQYNPDTNDVESTSLKGGYAMISYLKETGKGAIIPFSRYHYYAGGKKFEMDATRHRVKELEVGVEWQINRALELVTMYTVSDRSAQTSLDPLNQESGSLLRIQAQVNF